MDDKTIVLPYRSTAEDLNRLALARARGRDLSKVQSLNFGEHAFQGTLVAAYAFQFLDPDSKDLTSTGREYALAAENQKPRLLLGAMLTFEPYELLLEAVFDRGQPKETTLEWIETWWSTHKYGNSQTNRNDAAFTFAKFAEFVGIGQYLQGRRGRPTRIEWKETSKDQIRAIIDDKVGQKEPKGKTDTPAYSVNSSQESTQPTSKSTTKPPIDGNNVFVLSFSAGQTAELNLPAKVKAEEKKQLIALVELMVAVGENESNIFAGSTEE